MSDTLLHSIRLNVCLLADILKIQIALDIEPHDMPELINTALRYYVKENIDGILPTSSTEGGYAALINSKIIRKKRDIP